MSTAIPESRENLDYLSAPLNLTSTVGGSLNVGGIDVNSPRLGCSADQAIALQVVTPAGAPIPGGGPRQTILDPGLASAYVLNEHPVLRQ